ncbi:MULTISPECIES: trans-aconitate 2-methyltransferase [unclassified Mesorhizobium]|uniref:class I SAM-dependent methyltransferase n=1 Tax=unclassified Mesorhizobium TaxID=325217 RepID=UPI000FCC542C|nr:MULTISPECIES: class I SAM-dependent methyltransferase [unclassified Mesorhizobium]RVC47294.1 class I SAM-dependent methyltransferase [Mesorhizobium sp. M4A.F.Ca.ET.090.04.2.1]RWD53738.1 MAG: class I SAM-dependent methyltransferase [Mesorhizobium sp.]RWJ22622.1 MAG: class I SAM-dependent methyltransferase [Mesorhizobium sp.]RWN15073.1 MAG: class I SAM-dependent methyltransferase [Mesorhizobium sp.]RWN21013.1 MAG: class I SAM-dependent methyltransferase [Mesorhizobium sp.]
MSDKFIYDDNSASVYEKYTTMVGKVAEAGETAVFLERFSSGGSALELGIGNGRVAVPLSELGVKVEGIDNSESMLKLLANCTDQIKAWKGNIADFKLEQHYRLIYCVFGTLMLLVRREEQISCLRSAADLLDDDGALIIEMPVPSLDGFVKGHRMTTRLLDQENTLLTAEVHDSVNQMLTSTSLWFSGTSITRLPQCIRYVYHQELDTMAECVGLKLAERWEDWAEGAFTDISKRHISVYRRTSV